MSTPAPGWYPDPTAPGSQRYWDGTAWTDSTAAMPGFSAPQPAPGTGPVQPAVPAYAPAAPGYSRAELRPAAQVGFVEAIKLGFRKYGTFAGRATRAEYWWWYLFSILVFLPLYLVALVAAAASAPSGTTTQGTTGGSAAGAGIALVLLVVMLVVGLALLVPSISVMVRRLHDTGKSGWWYWISLVPFVGGIILLVLLVMESTPGANQFGPPSRGAADL